MAPAETHITLSENAALIIAGPTASGKSSLALHYAKDLDGVIINADSQQIYQGMPVLTAQPPEEDLTQAEHRLYSVLEPDDVCDAHRWREMAKAHIDDVLVQGQLPILVGGTGLYINALVDGLSPVPDIPDDVREGTAALIDEIGLDKVFQKLEKRDPDMAAKIDPQNTRRVARAWEVLEATGKSLADWQKISKEGGADHIEFTMISVMPERSVLRKRCDARFDDMTDNGAIDEVTKIDKLIQNRTLDNFSPITKALGFRPLQAFLHGHLKWDEAIEMAKAQTRQYAKRQVTWFRHQKPENAKAVLQCDPVSDKTPSIEWRNL